MILTVLHVDGCPNLQPLLDRLREVTDAPVETRCVSSEAEAAALGMTGSPTLLVDGRDPFRTPQAPVYGLSCRLYTDEQHRPVRVPSTAQLRAAVSGTPIPGAPVADGNDHAEILSSWRHRALPLDPALRSLHQTVLRSFATGSPLPDDDRLRELHELDAVRLMPDGQIAVAYPFSATPTRHRVRIGAVEVYAMCAIDALGIGPMLGTDTVISSVDSVSGRPITVSGAGWDPPGTVVFVGATGSGPSADCCCDYLNFFESRSSTIAWTTAHPEVPGEILDPEAAQALATRLFGPLLSN